MKIVQLGAVVAVVAGVVALAGVGRPDSARGSAAESRGVTVTGTANVKAVPDQAAFSFGVGTEAGTANAALAANAERAQRVVAALRAAGVARADLQTQDVSVSPRWDENGRVNGYAAHSSVQAKVENVGRAGPIVDAAVAAGATETSGPSFGRSNREELYRTALRQAFANARAKAEVLAGEAGASVGRVLRIEEGTPSSYEPAPVYDRALESAKTPVEPGTQEVEAQVTVTFSLA